MKSEEETDGPGGDAPLDEAELAAVKDYLREAPEGASRWASEQLKRLELGEESTPEADDETTPEAVDDDPVDLDPDDDIVSRKVGASKGQASSGGRYLVVAAIVVGVVFGVWFAGRDQVTEAASETPNLGTETSDVSSFDRMVELEYQLSKDADNIEARLELGVLLFDRKDLDAAKEQWDAVIELDPKNPNAWYNLGFLYLSSEPPDMDAVKEAWGKVVEYAPDSDMARNAEMHLSGLSSSQSGDTEKQS